MKTIFPKKECHIPRWFVVDAKGKTLGRLATEVSKLLRGKENSYFTPGVDQGNFVVVLNARHVEVTGKKALQKLYYRNSHTPGNLKMETFQQLQIRIPNRIVERAIWGMLPKGVLGREQYRRLYVYSDEEMLFTTKQKEIEQQKETQERKTLSASNWVHVKI